MSIVQPGSVSSPARDAAETFAEFIKLRPSIIIPIPSRSASGILFSGTGILAGYALRESGTAPTTTYVDASAAGAASAIAPAIAAGAAGTLNWITGFEVTGGGATAASVILVTLTGVQGGTLNYDIPVPAGITLGITPLVVEFPSPGLPAAALASAITLNVPSFGAGNTISAAVIHGYTASTGAAGGVVTQGPATAVFDLLDGQDATGQLLTPFAFTAGQFDRLQIGDEGPLVKNGVFLSMVSGTIKGALWVKR